MLQTCLKHVVAKSACCKHVANMLRDRICCKYVATMLQTRCNHVANILHMLGMLLNMLHSMLLTMLQNRCSYVWSCGFSRGLDSPEARPSTTSSTKHKNHIQTQAHRHTHTPAQTSKRGLELRPPRNNFKVDIHCLCHYRYSPVQCLTPLEKCLRKKKCH